MWRFILVLLAWLWGASVPQTGPSQNPAQTFGPNLDIVLEIASVPADLTVLDAIEIYARVTVPNQESLGTTFLRLNLTPDSPTEMFWNGDADSATVGSLSGYWGSDTRTLEAGDAIGFRLAGDTMSAYHRQGGVWNLVMTAVPEDYTDDPALASAGGVGVYFGSSTTSGQWASYASFSIGEWSGSAPAFPATQTAGDSGAGSGAITLGPWTTWFSLNGGGCTAPDNEGSHVYSGGNITNTEDTSCGFWAYLFGTADEGEASPSPHTYNCAPCTTFTDSQSTTSDPDQSHPCVPTEPTGNGDGGNSGCNNGGIGFTQAYTGPYGTVPVHPDPEPGETLTGKDTVDVWIKYVRRPYPATSPDTVTYGRGFIPLPHDPDYDDGYKEGGLQAVGAIEHGIGNEQGGVEAATVEIRYNDVQDRLFRNLLEDQELEGDEVYVMAGTPEGHAAGIPPRVLMRGIVQQPSLLSGRVAKFYAKDKLFAENGPFSASRQFPRRVPVIPGLETPAETLALPLPYLWGPKSDDGATPAEKGLIPGHFFGFESFESTTTPTFDLPPYDATITPPTRAGVLGQGGSGWGGSPNLDPYFAVAAETADGLSRLVLKGVSSRYDPVAHSFRVVFDGSPTPGVTQYRVFMYDAGPWDPFLNPTVAANPYYKVVSAATPNSPYDDWEFAVDFENRTDGTPLAAGTPVTATSEWGALLFMGFPMASIDQVFATDLGNGAFENERSRIEIDPDANPDILVPGYANWPFAERYRAYTAEDGTVYWLTIIYARNQLLEDHRRGIINITINGWGREDVGDGTGLPLFDAHACQQDFIENMLLGDWTSGPLATNTVAPQFEDGTYIVNTTSFADRQAFTAASLGGRGLTCSWLVDTFRSVPEWFERWNAQTESELGTDEDGRVIVWGLDETVDTSTWPRVDEVSDLFGNFQFVAGQDRENVKAATGDWDGDKQMYRGTPFTFVNTTAVEKFKGRRVEGERLEFDILREPTQMEWVVQRRLTRLGLGTRMVEITGGVGFHDHRIGTGILLTCEDGPGPNGYVDHPLIIKRKKFDIDPKLVTYTLLDVGAFNQSPYLQAVARG